MSTRERHDTDQAIFEHAAFVQALARQLVAPDAAGDVEQETWLAALEGRTGSGRPSSRAWLGGIVRNLARHEHRRRRRQAERERRAARREPSPSASEDAQRREALRRLSRAVFELDEPLQVAVVYRYYDGLSRAEIAERLGIGVEGVKSRLQRALAELRTRLDREHGGNRGAWALVIAPAFPTASATPIGTWILGTLIMSTKKTFLIGATLLVAVVAFVLWTRDAPMRDRDIAESALQSPSPRDSERAMRAESEREPVPTPDNADETLAPRVDLDMHDRATLAGRVVDDRRRPVTGATVELCMPDRAQRSSHTDANGDFRFTDIERPDSSGMRAALFAFDARGRAAARSCWIVSKSEEIDPLLSSAFIYGGPVIPLGPAHRLEIVSTLGGHAVPDVDLFVEAGLERREVRRLATDANGRAHIDHFPEGAVFVSASCGNLVGFAQAALDADSPPLHVALRPARSLDVVVRDVTTGLPVEGATVVVRDLRRYFEPMVTSRFGVMWHTWNLDIDPTDASGRTRVHALPMSDALRVVASKPGFGFVGRGPWKDEASVRLQDGVDSVELELTPIDERTVRIPVLTGTGPLPADGTPLTLRERPGYAAPNEELRPTRGLFEAGEIRIDRVPPGYLHALAATPDGALAPIRVAAAQTVGQETSFAPARSIEVRAHFPDDSAATGVLVMVRTRGNAQAAEPVQTDHEGRARIDGMPDDIFDVFVRHPHDPTHEVRAGSANLAYGDAHLDVLLPAVARLELQLFDGDEPRLPSTFRLHVRGGGGVLEERPEEGILVVSVHPSARTEELGITLFGKGYVTQTHDVPLAALESPDPFRIDLVRAGVVRANLTKDDEQKMGLVLEEWNLEKQVWKRWDGSLDAIEYPNDAYGRIRFEPLAPGRYRVLDTVSGVISDPVEVSPQSPLADVVLNAAASIRLVGRVVAPPTEDVSLARVLITSSDDRPASAGVWEDDIRGIPTGLEVRPDGTFELRVSRDRRATLIAWHPLLRPSSNSGSFEVSGPTDDIELVLEPGPELRFAVPDDGARSPYGGSGVHVALFHSGVAGTPIASAFAPVVDGIARFGGFDPGVYSLWIGAPTGYAPVVLRDVELREGVQEIDVEFERGSAIRARILVPEHEAVPRIYISAISEQDPEYLRQINSRGEVEVVLPGLGAGDFKLHYFVFGTEERHNAVITVDGVHDHEITIDLR